MKTLTTRMDTLHGPGDIQRQRGPRDATDEHLQPARLPLWREAFFGLDWLALVGSAVYSGRSVPRGDGSPVVVVPGLFASDWSLVELRCWLARLGYRPYFSEIGLNATCPTRLLARLSETIERAHLETGQRVRVVGHSLGGLLARGAALRRPDHVRQVITLGSPVSGLRAHPAVMAAAELLHGSCSSECVTALQRPLPSAVAEACLYSKRDGVRLPRARRPPRRVSPQRPGTAARRRSDPPGRRSGFGSRIRRWSIRTHRRLTRSRRHPWHPATLVQASTRHPAAVPASSELPAVERIARR